MGQEKIRNGQCAKKTLMRMPQIKILYIFVPNVGVIYDFDFRKNGPFGVMAAKNLISRLKTAFFSENLVSFRAKGTTPLYFPDEIKERSLSNDEVSCSMTRAVVYRLHVAYMYFRAHDLANQKQLL